ncbi:MAG: Gfo/Idh/MocA family oxidoreductase [Bacteroidia bacterium]|nr:Gfo/Idh/MocA family oxidoreductase [Bacteroidia bacterium]
MKIYLNPVFAILLIIVINQNLIAQEKLKIGVAGLTHTHVHWIFGSESRGDFEIVGIAEPNRELAKTYADRYNFPMSKVFDSLDQMIESTKPNAVAAFGTIYDHLDVVESCAPRGIHVMVEKPLAVSLEHARRMKELADGHGIQLLTNYETTWYPTNHMAYKLVKDEGKIGPIRKVIIRDGHKGPKKIGVNIEFLEWLTDPELNGGGAITDFGCYGANLMTWLMNGEKPISVTAVTQQLQPENNPKVDDEANIILTYKNATALIQASWNWPIGRKDMEIYGLKGVVYSNNRHDLRIRISEGYDGFSEEKLKLEERERPFDDPFSFFAAVIGGEIEIPEHDLSSLENNMVVMEILDAAVRSAKEGRTIVIRK